MDGTGHGWRHGGYPKDSPASGRCTSRSRTRGGARQVVIGSRPIVACGSTRSSGPAIRCMRSTRSPWPGTATATRLRRQIRYRRRQAAGRPGPHRPAQPPPDGRRQPEAEAIKVLARAHQNLIWARTRHTNALRSALREYYPARWRRSTTSTTAMPWQSWAALQHQRSRASEPGQDPVSPQTRWATTQPRYPRPRDRRSAAHRATRHPHRGHRRIRHDHPCRGRHYQRTEPPDHRPRSRTGHTF